MMKRTLSLAFAALAGLPLVALAQQQAGAPAKASAAAYDDATILAIYDAGNSYDMQTGQLAATHGASAAVRSLGAQLVREHRTVRRQGRLLATKLVAVARVPDDFAGREAHAEAMATLRSVRGREFDRAFLEHEVEYHAGMTELLRNTLIPQAKDAELKTLLINLAAAVEAHQLAAQHLLDQMASSAAPAQAPAHPAHAKP